MATDILNDIRVLFADSSQETLALYQRAAHALHWHGLYVESSEEMMDTINHVLNEGLELDAIVANIAYFSGTQVTGITAAREARKALPNVPIVFISEYVTSMIREEVRRVGGAEILEKPVDPEKLFIRLSNLIYWHRLVIDNEYKGDNRRKASVNRTDNQRRATDYVLTTPERISQVLADVERDKQ